MDFDQLMELAAEMGVTVTEGHLPAGWWGAYNWITNVIVLIGGLTMVQKRCVLAHELGHAFYQHRDGSPGSEQHAREWGAQLLIGMRPYALAVANGADREEAARRLRVTPETVDDYVRWGRRPSNFHRLSLWRSTYRREVVLEEMQARRAEVRLEKERLNLVATGSIDLVSLAAYKAPLVH